MHPKKHDFTVTLNDDGHSTKEEVRVNVDISAVNKENREVSSESFCFEDVKSAQVDLKIEDFQPGASAIGLAYLIRSGKRVFDDIVIWSSKDHETATAAIRDLSAKVDEFISPSSPKQEECVMCGIGFAPRNKESDSCDSCEDVAERWKNLKRECNQEIASETEKKLVQCKFCSGPYELCKRRCVEMTVERDLTCAYQEIRRLAEENEALKSKPMSASIGTCTQDDHPAPEPDPIRLPELSSEEKRTIERTVYRVSDIENVPQDPDRKFVPCMYINVKVRGSYQEEIALVDSGSTCCIISESAARRAGLVIENYNRFHVRGLGGEKGPRETVSVIGTAKANVRICSHETKEQSFFVLDDSKMPYDTAVFLGWNFIKENGLDVDFANRRVCKMSQQGDEVVWIHNSVCNEHKGLYKVSTDINTVSKLKCRVMSDIIFSAKPVNSEHSDYIVPLTIDFPEQIGENMELVLESTLSEEEPVQPVMSIHKMSDGNVAYMLLKLRGILHYDYVIPKGSIIAEAATVLSQENHPEAFKFVSPEQDKEGLCNRIEEGERTEYWTRSKLRETFDLTHLSPEHQEQIIDVLQECSGALSRNKDDIGQLKGFEYRIGLLDSTPVYAKPRRFHPEMSDKINKEVNRLLGLGIIEHSSAPYSSNVVPVIKPNGELRMCIGFQRVNERINPDLMPVPSTVELTAKLSGSKIFSKIDLRSAYLQIPLHPESRDLTTFSTDRVKCRYKFLCFGLSCSVGAFNRVVASILDPLGVPKEIGAYFDDLLVNTRGMDRHISLLRLLLSTLQMYGMKISPEKSIIAKEEVEYLGCVVSADGVRRTEDRIKVIQDLSPPKTMKEAQHFLGLIAYQQKFLRLVAEKTCLINDAVSRARMNFTGKIHRKKDIPIQLNEEELQAFREIQRAVCEDVMLAYPETSPDANPIEMYIDASDRSIGCMLAQNQVVDEGTEQEKTVKRVLTYTSTPLNKHQRNYSVTHKELAAMRLSVQKHKNLLLGAAKPVQIFTDHISLKYLLRNEVANQRVARTLEELSNIKYQINYIKGELNTQADILSRLDIHPNEPEIEAGPFYPKTFFRVIEVPGGPNSMFEALHRTLKKTVESYSMENQKQLREVLVEGVIQNRTKYFKESKDLNKKLRDMKFDNSLPCWEVLLEAS